MRLCYATFASVLGLLAAGLSPAPRYQPALVFDFDCARPSDFPKGQLVVEVSPEVLRHGGKPWADRAVKYDLDRDGGTEYFVPTFCGATGNCQWGLFSLSPTRAIAQLTGARIYIGAARGWPRITTYERSGLGKGEIREYEFQSGKYVEVAHKVVEADENDAFLRGMGDPTCSSR